MDDTNVTYFVDFYKYCKLCEYDKLSEKDEPCNRCLEVGDRVGTRKPEKFKKAKR